MDIKDMFKEHKEKNNQVDKLEDDIFELELDMEHPLLEVDGEVGRIVYFDGDGNICVNLGEDFTKGKDILINIDEFESKLEDGSIKSLEEETK